MRLQHLITPVWLGLFLLSTTDTPAQSTDQPQAYIYRVAGKDTLKAYVFQPQGVKGPRPAILLFHGGGWQLGEAGWTFDRARQFAEKGMVAISIDYRLANHGLTPVDGVEDACAAFIWVRQQAKKFQIDPKRVAGYGISAGGHLVAAAATLPSVRGAGVPKEARPDLMLLYSPALNVGHDGYFVRLMGQAGNPPDYSPSEFIGKTLPPTLIIQGQQDSIVYTSDALQFRDSAIRAGSRCELHIYPGVGHLLTRNIHIQYKDFDPDPAMAADAHQKEDAFLGSLGWYKP